MSLSFRSGFRGITRSYAVRSDARVHEVIEVSHGGRLVVTHDRLHLRGAESLVLDHYLDVLADKPGAFPGSLPLHQARERDEFPPSYDRLWSRLTSRSGDKAGTRGMIEVLLLHRHHPKGVVRQAVDPLWVREQELSPERAGYLRGTFSLAKLNHVAVGVGASNTTPHAVWLTYRD